MKTIYRLWRTDLCYSVVNTANAVVAPGTALKLVLTARHATRSMIGTRSACKGLHVSYMGCAEAENEDETLQTGAHAHMRSKALEILVACIYTKKADSFVHILMLVSKSEISSCLSQLSVSWPPQNTASAVRLIM